MIGLSSTAIIYCLMIRIRINVMHDIAVDTQVTVDWQTEDGRLRWFCTLDK